MAGKSTYMRELAIIVIMAQIGSFVPCKKCVIPIFDKIFTRIGATDDLVGGESTFMVEMKEANRAITDATPNSLILFDELGRGTATYDGMSLAEAILEYIHNNIHEDEQDEKQVYNNLDLIDKYIDRIMTNINYPLYGIDEEEITFNDVEKLIKKMNQNHLKIIRIKTDIINAIIDKKLGGNNQGWEPKEHEEFLKLKNSYNNRINTYEFLTALSTTIPYIPVSELKNHIYLYEKYIKINDIKKLLLNKYKEIKKKKDEEEKEKKIQK